MIKNNKFYISNVKNIIFFGESSVFKNLIQINNLLKLKTFIIASSDQCKNIPKNINFKIFNNIDKNCQKYISKNFNIEQTIFISLGARYIFKKEIINNFLLNNLVNFHGSRLPLNAGGGGMSWRIMCEDRIDNQLVHLINDKIDSGPILQTDTSIFPTSCKSPKDFYEHSTNNFIKFYEKFIRRILNKEYFDLFNQVNYLGKYFPRLNTKINGFIDWNLQSYDLLNFINSFDDPYEGASTLLNRGKFGTLYIKSVHLHGGEVPNHPFMSGIITRHDKKWLVVSTKNRHSLLIEKVINSKGENIINNLKVGDRFHTPYKFLDDAKNTRIGYKSNGLFKLQ
jgi:methionyl-tRNA formyltransferase